MDWEISGWEAQCDAGGLGKGPQWVEGRVQAGKAMWRRRTRAS